MARPGEGGGRGRRGKGGEGRGEGGREVTGEGRKGVCWADGGCIVTPSHPAYREHIL
jgi:hypothetical protein